MMLVDFTSWLFYACKPSRLATPITSRILLR